MGDILIFLFGLAIGLVGRTYKKAVRIVPVPLTNRTWGCSKTIQHVCNCVKPHGHEMAEDDTLTAEIRWHVCEHGAVYTQAEP